MAFDYKYLERYIDEFDRAFWSGKEYDIRIHNEMHSISNVMTELFVRTQSASIRRLPAEGRMLYILHELSMRIDEHPILWRFFRFIFGI